MKTSYQKFNILLKWQFRLNWKMILFFGLFWGIISVGILSLSMINTQSGFKFPMIANQQTHWTRQIIEHNENNGSTSTQDSSASGNVMSIATLIKLSSFGIPGLVLYTIFTLVLLNKIVLKETNNTTLSSWMTLPLSRSQIVNTKYLFTIITNLILLSPSFFMTIIYAGIANDADVYFGKTILYLFQYVLFLIALISVYFYVIIALVNKPAFANTVVSLIEVYIVAMWTLNSLYNQDSSIFKYFIFAQYITPMSLIVDTLSFSSDLLPEQIIKQKIIDQKYYETWALIKNEYINYKVYLVPIFMLINTSIVIGGFLGAHYTFKSQNFNL